MIANVKFLICLNKLLLRLDLLFLQYFYAKDIGVQFMLYVIKVPFHGIIKSVFLIQNKH